MNCPPAAEMNESLILSFLNVAGLPYKQYVGFTKGYRTVDRTVSRHLSK